MIPMKLSKVPITLTSIAIMKINVVDQKKKKKILDTMNSQK